MAHDSSADDARRVAGVSTRSTHPGAPTDVGAVANVMLQRLPDVVLRYDRDGRVLFANEAVRDVAGLPPSHYVGRVGVEVSADPERARQFEAARAAVLATGEPTVIEVRRDTPAGPRWFEYRVVPEEVVDGSVRTVLAVGRDVTDARLALEAARASEARYRALVEATAQVVWQAGPNGELDDGLSGWRAYTGQARDPARHASGSEWLDAVHPDDRAGAAAAWSQAMRTSAPYEARYRVRRWDGAWRTVVARAVPVRDAEGRVLEWIGTITDVTEAERGLSELETERALLLEAERIARLGSWSWDAATDQMRLSRQWLDILGADQRPGEDAEALLRRLMPPEDYAAYTERFAAVQRDRTPTSEHTYRFVRADGAVRVLNFRGAWRFDDAGRLLSGAGTFQDVTEQASAERELVRQRELLEESQRLAHVGSWELDLATNEVASSAEMLRIAGLPPAAAELTPDQIGAMMGDEREYVMERLAEGIATGQPIEYEHHIHRPDGAVRLVLARGRMVRNADGATVRVVGASQDITERRALELQLRQTQKMEALGLLAGSVAHDFNNLLSAILGGADLARHEVPDGSVAAADLDDVRHAARRAAELTRQLLAFSRKQPHRLRVLDLREVARRAEPLLRRLLPETVTLDLARGPLPCVIRADAGQIEQVLVNLVVNARDAIAAACPNESAGGVTVEVTARALPQGLAAPVAGGALAPGVYAALVVRDTGTGMSAETMRRIFEPFFTTKPDGRGTGLGLSTVFGIVVQSGGAIDVQTALGVGTTFTVLLPTVDEPLDVADFGDAGLPRGGSETVLLVEDERVVRETATRILERNGYRVIATRHGADAVMAWEEQGARIDVLVTDLRMPAMGGRALVDTLRARKPDLPLVVMSGYTSEQDEGEAALLQRELFLEKPFTAESLLGHVRAALDRRGRDRERGRRTGG